MIEFSSCSTFSLCSICFEDFPALVNLAITFLGNNWSWWLRIASKVLMTTLHPVHVTTFWAFLCRKDGSSGDGKSSLDATMPQLRVWVRVRVPSVVCTTTSETIVKRPKRCILISPTHCVKSPILTKSRKSSNFEFLRQNSKIFFNFRF